MLIPYHRRIFPILAKFRDVPVQVTTLSLDRRRKGPDVKPDSRKTPSPDGACCLPKTRGPPTLSL